MYITAAGTEATGTRRNANSGRKSRMAIVRWEEAAVRWQGTARRGETEKESPGGYLGKHMVTPSTRLAQVMIGSRGWPTLDRSTDRDLES